MDLVLPDAGSAAGAEADPRAQSIAVVLVRLELLLCAGCGTGRVAWRARHLRARGARPAHGAEYEAAGITADPTTHQRPVPLLSHLHSVLNQMDTDVAARLATRLRRHIPGAGSLGTGVFAGRANVVLDQPFVVFHIRELPREHGETSLTNSEMKLLLKQSEEINDAADARSRFTPGERRFLLGALKGEGLLLARGGRWPLKVEASPAEHRLATTNPRELEQLTGAESRHPGRPVVSAEHQTNGVLQHAPGRP